MSSNPKSERSISSESTVEAVAGEGAVSCSISGSSCNSGVSSDKFSKRESKSSVLSSASFSWASASLPSRTGSSKSKSMSSGSASSISACSSFSPSKDAPSIKASRSMSPSPKSGELPESPPMNALKSTSSSCAGASELLSKNESKSISPSGISADGSGAFSASSAFGSVGISSVSDVFCSSGRSMSKLSKLFNLEISSAMAVSSFVGSSVSSTAGVSSGSMSTDFSKSSPMLCSRGISEISMLSSEKSSGSSTGFCACVLSFFSAGAGLFIHTPYSSSSLLFSGVSLM